MPKRLKYKYHQNGTFPALPCIDSLVLVFESNLAGLHRREAALIASDYYGAEIGVPIGVTGRCYAIPTKDRFIRMLSLREIKAYIDQFIAYTHSKPELKFWVTNLGTTTGSEYKPYNMAPMFIGANTNCNFPDHWKPYLK